MRRFLLTNLLTLVVMAVMPFTAFAELKSFEILTGGKDANDEPYWPNCNQYYLTTTSNASFGGSEWVAVALSNNNNAATWGDMRCGRKNNASVATISNKVALNQSVTKFVVNTKFVKTGKNDKLNSVSLLVADNAELTNATKVDFTDFGTAGDWEFIVAEPASGMYYQLVFDCASGTNNGWLGIEKITVYYEEGQAPSVEAPTFSLVEGMEGFSVAMATETEGAEIYYTEDGTVPTVESTKYTAPVEVWFKTTFKAVAIKDGESSYVSTYEANPPYILPDFTPLSDFEPESGKSIPVIIKGSMTVLYQSGSYLYLKAGNSYMLVYGALDKEFTNGDTFSRLEGDFILFNGQPEIQNPEIVGDVTPGSPVAPTPAYLDEVAQNRMCHYLTIKNVNISGVVEGSKDATITDEYGTEVALRNNFGLTLENLENCTIVGFVGIYTNKSGVTTIQFNPTEIIPAAPAAPEPVVTVDGTPVTGSTINLKENEEAVIEFTLAEGVEVYYNITETAAEEIAPAAEEEMEFTKYTEPLKISKSSILTYYSVANGVKSEVATLTISGTTAITEIMAGEGEAEYFDLMGRRVENPANGLYIRRAAGKVEKVLVK